MREKHISLTELHLPPADREIEAMTLIVRAFEHLDPEARGRVIDWAFARYVESVSTSENATPVPAGNNHWGAARLWIKAEALREASGAYPAGVDPRGWLIDEATALEAAAIKRREEEEGE